MVVPEYDWEQKLDEQLKQLREVVYLPRTYEISTTQIKRDMANDNGVIQGRSEVSGNKTNPAVAAWRAIVPVETRRALYHLRKGTKSGFLRSKSSEHHTPGSSSNGQPADEIPNGRTRGPLLSVIMPVYKVEEYLDEAVQSVLKQTYRDFELILVDDGSPDRCGEMCDAWAKKDRRIRVLHKVNGGLSDARNKGMEVAVGEYVAFVDSDDTLDHRAYERMMGTLLKTGSDMATGHVSRFNSARRWAGWNQSYSHSRDYYPDLPSGARVAERVTLEDHPELLFDTTSWNKVYRRALLEKNSIEFPVGKLYEDMYPVLRAMYHSTTIDVVFDSVYNYRVRDDRSSITQRRAELKNLADKMEMVRRSFDYIPEGPNGDALRDVLRFKLFEGDLPVYAPYLGQDADFDAVYMDMVSRYWPETSADVLAKCTLARRTLFAWQATGDIQKAAEAEAWVNKHFFEIPLVERDGRACAQLEKFPEIFAPLIDRGLEDMSRYVKLRSTVTDAQIIAGLLHVEGFVFIDMLPPESDVQMQFSIRDSNGNTVPLQHAKCDSEWANDPWWTGAQDRSASGFTIDQPLAEALPCLAAEDSVQWELWIQVSCGAYSFSEPVSPVWRGGAIRLGDIAANEPQGWIAAIDWSDWKSPLRILQRRASAICDSVVAVNSSLAVRVRGLDGRPAPSSLRFVREHDKLVVNAVVLSEDLSVTASMSMSRITGRDVPKGARNGWFLEAKSERGQWTRVSGVPGLVRAREDRGWSLRGDAKGDLCFVDDFSSLVVETIDYEKGQWVLTGHCPLDVDPESEVLMWSNEGAKESAVLSIDSHGRFSIAIPLRKPSWYSENDVAWRTGEYHFWLRADDVDSKYRIRASSALVEHDLQKNVWDGNVHSRFHVAADSYDITMRVGPGLTHEERGRYNAQRLEEFWAAKPDNEVQPLEAAVFASFMQGNACDSPLAIFEEMRRRGLDLDYYWAVSDGAAVVPDGATPLLRGSAEYFEVLSRARYVINNVGAIRGYGDRSFQRMMQTWHGTPLKHIGRSMMEEDPEKFVENTLRAQEEGDQWDWLISPNPFFSSIAPRDLFFDGEILPIGYPRNDRLVKATAEEASALRERFKIGEDAKVLLYAPTFRDNKARGFSSPLVDILDLDKLVGDLGEDWVVILRGHNYNHRDSGQSRSRDRIIDLTSHHDINDLLLISDVLLTDYSSVMFDYLCTGKPVLNFVPDMDEYLATRGTYMEIAEAAPAPLLMTYQHLLNELLDLDHYTTKYGDKYKRLADEYVPWDDGCAASRAVDALLQP